MTEPDLAFGALTSPPNPLSASREGGQDELSRNHWHSPPGQWDLLKEPAREMRKKPTDAEQVLWQRLRRKELGLRFRRQHPLDRFIVDLCCPAAKLVVEVDGEIHKELSGYDAEREAILVRLGYRVLRFTNHQVLSDTDMVLRQISSAVKSTPLPARGEGLGEG